MRRPHFIAEQARHARGPLGRLIASIMVGETQAQNDRAIEALGVEDGDHVVDIGCGPGRSLTQLARLTPEGRAVGADPSALMVEITARRNRALVKSGSVTVVVAPAEALPFPDESFDKALCVHVLYFWPDLAASFREMARILKPGARLALLFRSVEDLAAVKAFPADVYRFRTPSEVLHALHASGFEATEIASNAIATPPGPHLMLATKVAS